MTLNEIKTAVRSGLTVNWVHSGYKVQCYKCQRHTKQWLIVCGINSTSINLTLIDDVTLNGEELDFYISPSKQTDNKL